jgi:hypothetical protein
MKILSLLGVLLLLTGNGNFGILFGIPIILLCKILKRIRSNRTQKMHEYRYIPGFVDSQGNAY